ncbi:MAG: hypothetical protein ABEK50_15455 [bacterium]
MDFLAENHSLYPRVGETDEELRLRRAYHRFDDGEIDRSRLNEIEDSYAEDVINEQLNAGLDIVTDGMIRWYDHISHLADQLTGTDVAGLVRYFDTNYLVREAKVTGPVEWRNPLVVDEFELANSVSSEPVKMVLPGPLTLTRHSIIDDDIYSSEKLLAEDYAIALQQELRALADAGLKHVQIEEPSLLQTPSDAEWVMPLLNKLADSTGSAEARLTTYFGDVVPLYEEFQDSNYDVLTFDFTYSDSLTETIQQQGTDKPLSLGLLNGRNTKLGSLDEITSTVETLEPQLTGETNYLTFSCSIDYLPRNKARRKLEQLSEFRDRLTEGVAQV